MSAEYVAPNLMDLKAEQGIIQETKFQGRLLAEYNGMFFPGQDYPEPRSSAVEDLVRPYCHGELSLRGLLDGLRMRNGRNVHWVEMGGGRALAMRQIAAMTENTNAIKMTNIDLFDYGFKGVVQEELDYLENLAPGMTANESKPRLVQADMQTIVLPEKADLITSVETTQYLDNPLVAISNWYNQLSDQGLMVISADRYWSESILYDRDRNKQFELREQSPMRHFLEQLQYSRVPFAASEWADWYGGHRPDFDPNHFRTLVIQKQPHTYMRVNAPLVSVETFRDFKVPRYYESNDLPIVEILKGSQLTKHLSRAAFK